MTVFLPPLLREYKRLSALPNAGKKHKAALVAPFYPANQGVSPPTLEQQYKIRLEKICASFKPEDAALIRAAFDFAAEKHRGMTRKDGRPYISHPLAVAELLNDKKATRNTIVAGLLHDVLEDCDITKEELAQIFKRQVASIVEGVTEIGKGLGERGKKVEQKDQWYKWLSRGMRNQRVITIRIADRQHNMRTLDAMEPDKAQAKAQETMDFHIPVVDALGGWNDKRELEDLALYYTNKDLWQRIERKRRLIIQDSQASVEKTIAKLIKEIPAARIFCERRRSSELLGRMKKQPKFQKEEEISEKIDKLATDDVWRIVIVMPTETECFAALPKVHGCATIIHQDQIRDYIKNPRPNGHKFLQTYVDLDPGKMLIQIRDEEMDTYYRCGLTATKPGTRKKRVAPLWMGTLASLLKEKGVDPKVIWENMRQLGEGVRIYFNYRGHFFSSLSVCPGSTILDVVATNFSKKLLRLLSAEVNGISKPFDYILAEGDSLAITVGRKITAELTWLKCFYLQEGKETLRAYLRSRKPAGIDAAANELLKGALEKHCFPVGLLRGSKLFAAYLHEKGLGTVDQFIYKVGVGELEDPTVIINGFFEQTNESIKIFQGNKYPVVLKITGPNRSGFLVSYTNKLSSLGIDMEEAFARKKDADKDTPTILLKFELCQGTLGDHQFIQIRETLAATKREAQKNGFADEISFLGDLNDIPSISRQDRFF